MAQLNETYVTLELGFPSLGIPHRKQEALITYNYDEGVPMEENSGLVQLEKLNIVNVHVATPNDPGLWYEITPLLTREEMHTIGQGLMEDHHYKELEGDVTH